MTTTGAMLPLVSKFSDILVLAPPQSRRLKAYQASLRRYGLDEARVLSYHDYLNQDMCLRDVMSPTTLLRIESPDEDFEIEKRLLARGDVVDEESSAYHRVSAQEARQLGFDKGLILPSRQWYLGFRELLKGVQDCLGNASSHVMNQPLDILEMFDKRLSHRKCARAGIPVPPAIAPVASFDELLERMAGQQCRRVFLKFAHGSSASGTVALEGNGKDWQASTTVEMLGAANTTRLYNSRKLLRYRNPQQIARLVNNLCGHRLHVEQWIPKASFQGFVFDLRVVVIAGRARHVLPRLSRGPITNLHLQNQRGDWQALRRHLPEATWQAIRRSCEAVARLWPKSLYMGVDVLVTPSLKSHYVLEVNAFGDYHRNIYHEGLDTFAAELAALDVPLMKTTIQGQGIPC